MITYSQLKDSQDYQEMLVEALNKVAKANGYPGPAVFKSVGSQGIGFAKPIANSSYSTPIFKVLIQVDQAVGLYTDLSTDRGIRIRSSGSDWEKGYKSFISL